MLHLNLPHKIQSAQQNSRSYIIWDYYEFGVYEYYFLDYDPVCVVGWP
jgi:hypothetical protein